MFRYTKWTLLREIITIIAALFMLLPFYILITTSLKSGSEAVNSNALALPATPTFSNFVQLLQPTANSGGATILVGLLNSVLITAGSIVLLIIVGSLCAYVIARRTARWSRTAYYIFLIAITLPAQLGVVPLYIGAKNLGLTGSIIGMIIIYTGTLCPLSVFLYAGFFRTVPIEYEEAAIIDGASRIQVFTRVVFPLMSPATGTVAIFIGLIVWNDFFTSLIFLNGSGNATLPVIMYNYVGSLVSQWNLIFAVVIVSMIPILAFYLFAQKKFIQGFSGGLKA
ncbi:carbohydrate ABC transporter permease [Subtercola sp. YIM 133946]|uniref:carbohydrate ABC transporter permease n=1 Tax=Subtercola sp. YIM 133946 TaxID=3118909 RepID=UPI002F951F5D